MVDGSRQFDVAEVPRTGVVGKMACLTPANQFSLKFHTGRVTHTSRWDIGPSCGSYSPPFVGRLRLSRRIGLSSFLTEIERMSSEVRKEKEREETSLWREWAISMVARLSAKLHQAAAWSSTSSSWYPCTCGELVCDGSKFPAKVHPKS